MELKYEPQRVLCLYDLPLPSPNILQTYATDSPAGCSLAVGIGAAIANPALKVIIFIDSAKLWGKCLSSLLAASQSNHNLTIVAINFQADIAISRVGLTAVLAADCGYVARGFVGDISQLKTLFKSAAKHDGLAILEVLVPPSDNPSSTYAAYRSRIFKLQGSATKAADWPAADAAKAIQMLNSPSERLDTGLFYRRTGLSPQSRLLKRLGTPLVDQPLKNISIRALVSQYK
jgi:2-oxoglutarate ferredoxin oxidoreductase subunit beta